jgi:hypothetical protein
VIAAAFLLHAPLAALAWAALTWVGLRGWYRAKKLAVAVHNAAFCGSLRPRLLDVHRRAVEHVLRAEPA